MTTRDFISNRVTDSFHGSSRKVYQWPPPRGSSVERERPSTPMGELKHDIRWNQQDLERERMTTPPPFARSPQVGRRKVVWPPPSPTTEQTPFFEPGYSSSRSPTHPSIHPFIYPLVHSLTHPINQSISQSIDRWIDHSGHSFPTQLSSSNSQRVSRHA